MDLAQKTNKLGQWLASAHIVFWTMPWLMILVVLGTVTQKELGLYVATEKYLNSIIAWIGPIPTPGGITIITIIFISLSVKFIFYSGWSWKKSGIHLSHLGVLLLLLGGLVTSFTTREGFMIIPEGQSLRQFADYQDKVVNFSKDNAIIQQISFDQIKKDKIIKADDMMIKIMDVCHNCEAQAPSGKYDDLQGLAANMELFSVPNEKNIEANFSGVTFAITKAKDETALGTYIIMEDIPKNPIVDDIEIILTRSKTALPFAIQLNDFEKINYPQTQKAREYQSTLTVLDGDLSWPAQISMNKPLRYKGYTFYQSSFDQTNDVEITVLNVVKNEGRYFPYISTFIIFFGLVLHLFMRLRGAKK